jgi:hypothetical protein
LWNFHAGPFRCRMMAGSTSLTYFGCTAAA